MHWDNSQSTLHTLRIILCSHPLTAIFSQLAPVYKHTPLCKPIFNKACGPWLFQKQWSGTLGLHEFEHMFLGERQGLTARSRYKKKSNMCRHGEGIPHGVEVGVNLILDDHEQGSSQDQMTAVGWHLKNVVRRQLDNWVFQFNQPPFFWAFCIKGTGATLGGYKIFWWSVMGKLVSLDKELLSKTSYTYSDYKCTAWLVSCCTHHLTSDLVIMLQSYFNNTHREMINTFTS